MAKKKPIIHMIGVDCPPELEEKFNKWYNERHAPDMLKSGKVRKATRYKMIETSATIKGGGMPVPYIAVYDFDSMQDFEEYSSSPFSVAMIKDAQETWPEWEKIRKFRVQYEAIRSWER